MVIFLILFCFLVGPQSLFAVSLQDISVFECRVLYNKAIPGYNINSEMLSVYAKSATSAVEIVANKFVLYGFGLVHPSFRESGNMLQVSEIDCNWFVFKRLGVARFF